MENQRILIVDDQEHIHEDFESILTLYHPSSRPRIEGELFESPENEYDDTIIPNHPTFVFEHAYQGKEAFEMVKDAVSAEKPYAVHFIDVRMPPGWDGIETTKRIWSVDPHAEIIICTAFSDYSWPEMLRKLGPSDQLQFLRKPFDTISVQQMALAMTRKWNLARRAREYTEELQSEVTQQTKELHAKVEALEHAMQEIKELRGILPMCAWCHKIRTDDDYWHQVDEYIDKHTKLEISHSMCPECYRKMKNDMNSDSEAPPQDVSKR